MIFFKNQRRKNLLNVSTKKYSKGYIQIDRCKGMFGGGVGTEINLLATRETSVRHYYRTLNSFDFTLSAPRKSQNNTRCK